MSAKWIHPKPRLLLLFSHQVMSNSLWPHGLQHTKLPCPLLLPGICSNSCPLSWWCHQPSHPLLPHLLLPSVFPRIRIFSSELALCIRCPQYWSFSILSSNEYSGLIYIRIAGWSPCCPRDSQESSPAPQWESINSLVLSFLYGPTLTSIHDYWKNHSFDYMHFCQQSDVSAF